MHRLSSGEWHKTKGRSLLVRGMSGERMETPGSTNSYGLTCSELAVVSLLIEGLADEQIAGQLAIDTHAVQLELANVLAKTGAKSRTEAAIRIIKRGFLRHGGTMD